MSGSLQPPQGGRHNKGSAFLSVALVFTIIALMFVLARIYVRIWVKHAFGWDDGMVILSMLLALVSTSFNIPEVLAGYGQHLYYLSDGDIIESLKWNYLATPLLIFSLAASKISICVFLLRVLDRTRAKFKRSFPYGIIALLTVIAIPSAGYSLGQCQPVRKLWNPLTPGHCQDPSNFVRLGYANGAINAFGDFALALFPLSFIKDLNLSFHRKVVLGLLMCCGIVCGVLAITRTILTGDLTAQSDVTYDSVDSSLFAVVEENVSIIVSCVPTLGPIFQSIDDKLKFLKSTHYPNKNGHTPQSDPHKGTSISLHVIPNPPRAVIQYESSAAAAGNTYEDSRGTYGSETSLVPGIQKITRVEVQRSEV
ncbi:hypothetical protein ABVK25_001391 [Lepraria finkii]|uniref:Rhodopsin domain-containing protein n=1 Tax=Lepraria finkii TaxID=1340010 RepID=A0ABR4BLJ4_9LECA